MSQPEYNTHTLPSEAKRQRVRLYAVIRIIDNRLQALAPAVPEDPDSELDWTDLGGETRLWKDRETAFQIGRAEGGLLVSADGLPGPHRMTAFHAALREMRDEHGTPAAQVEPTPAAPAKSGKEIARATREAAMKRDAKPEPDGEQPY